MNKINKTRIRKMKLLDVKERIDSFFDNITPDELYELSLRYGFKEIKDDDEDNITKNFIKQTSLETIEKTVPHSSKKNKYKDADCLVTAV